MARRCAIDSWPTRSTASCSAPRDRSARPTRLGFWDALSVAVAARSGARRVVSEDLNAGQSIAGITIHNPFKKHVQAKPRR